MQGNINMNGNKINNLSDPQTNTEPVTKQYGDRTYLTDTGFVMNDYIGMNNHMITNLGTPTNDTDSGNKKYVDDKKCKFKDGTSTTLDIDLRSDEFHDDITFNAKAYCQDLDSTATSKSIINKNTLETGHLITMNSITLSSYVTNGY